MGLQMMNYEIWYKPFATVTTLIAETPPKLPPRMATKNTTPEASGDSTLVVRKVRHFGNSLGNVTCCKNR